MKKENKKNTRKKNTGNLIFSAVLVTAFVLCSYFFMGMIDKLNQAWLKSLLCIVVFVLFGLFLFYATRVGDGKQVVRFSPATLILMDLPALYIILAAMISELPFSAEITSCAPVIYLASVVFGYGVPYTFVSGYEIDTPNPEEIDEETGEEELGDNFVVESEGESEIVINEDDDESESGDDAKSEPETEEKE